MDNVEIVTTDDGGLIAAQYQAFVKVISKIKAETLPPHRQIDHVINLGPDYKLRYGRIHNLSQFELQTLKAIMEMNLPNSFIQRATSSAAAPIVVSKKEETGLWSCVDYRAHNLGTVQNRYQFPPIPQLLDQVREAQIFTNLDLRNAYHLIRVKEGDKFRTTFRTGYGQFEYDVKRFGLTNSPATFQTFIALVNSGILTTSPCATLMIYSSNRPI